MPELAAAVTLNIRVLVIQGGGSLSASSRRGSYIIVYIRGEGAAPIIIGV